MKEADGPLARQIRAKLEAALNPQKLTIIDESALHAGHGHNHPHAESHFRLEIVSDRFRNKTRIERTRMIHAILKEEFEQNMLHAMALKTFSDEEDLQLSID